MSFFSFLKRNKESYSLVFNIGSGSVSGGVIRFTEAPGENVTYYDKQIIPFQQEISIPKHVELMNSSLITLAGKIRTEGLNKIKSKNKNLVSIDRVFYLFSSPWSVSQTKTIRIKESKPFKITENYLNHIIDEQEKQFQTDISKYGKIIEKKIIQVKVNGYTVNNPYNKMTKDLEISVFFTVVPEDILQTVENAVSKVFNTKSIWCHSSSLAVFSVIRDLFPQKEDFIQIDTSEEITDISIIKDNIIISNASIPLGRNHFIRELSSVLKVTEGIANSMIRMHCLKENDQLANLKLAVAMDTAAKNWLDKIFEVLDALKEKIYVPESIFLVISCDLAPFLKEKLQKQDFKILFLDNRKIRPPMAGDDLMFKLELMFLDNIYKI